MARLPLSNRTNIGFKSNALQQNSSDGAVNGLLVGTESKGRKRTNENFNEALQSVKKLKLEKRPSYEVEESVNISHRLPRRSSIRAMRAIVTSGSAIRSWHSSLSTAELLKSFVSSHKSDVHKCYATDINSFLTAPYACAYSHASKRGASSLLAVATEQGTVEIFNTARREEWDVEPPHQSIRVHENGIFDIKWSMCDANVATSSGDSTVRISDVRTGTCLHTLQGHTRTVKCIGWDPNHRELLSSAGRDGQILLWDLRERSINKQELHPVLAISAAHEKNAGKAPKKSRNSASTSTRSVTSLLYLPYSPYALLSGGSADGILRKWDMRQKSSSANKSTATKTCLEESAIDPTILNASPRPRGIASLALGSGPTASTVFGLSTDSKIHTYNASGASDIPLQINQIHDGYNTYSHERMCAKSFYVKVAVSDCGRWLACGGSNGSAFLFDVAENREHSKSQQNALELKGQAGEVGAIDWAEDQLATCADDGTVRIWRPNLSVQRRCVNDASIAQWSWSWANQHVKY